MKMVTIVVIVFIQQLLKMDKRKTLDESRAYFLMEDPVGFEPTIRELQSHALATWLWVHHVFNYNKKLMYFQVNYMKKIEKYVRGVIK